MTAPKNDQKTLKEGQVEIRITKIGHRKVSTGERAADVDLKYSYNDIVIVPEHVGRALESRGYAEVQGDELE